MVADGPTTLNRQRFVDFAATHRTPTMYEWNFIVREGGLMSYGPGMEDRLQQAARYIDRILKGAKPTALPAEPPTRYYLAVNLKTATTDPIRGASHLAILLGRSI